MTEANSKDHRARAEEFLGLASGASLTDVANQMKLSAIAELLMSVDDKLTKLAELGSPPRLEISYGDMRASLGNGGAA